MYVCNCNGLSRRAVDAAIADGAHTMSAVFRKLDSEPQCGKCVCEVRALLATCKHKNRACSAARPNGDCSSIQYMAAAE